MYYIYTILKVWNSGWKFLKNRKIKFYLEMWLKHVLKLSCRYHNLILSVSFEKLRSKCQHWAWRWTKRSYLTFSFLIKVFFMSFSLCKNKDDIQDSWNSQNVNLINYHFVPTEWEWVNPYSILLLSLLIVTLLSLFLTYLHLL